MADEYSRSPLGFSFIHRTVPVKTYRVGVPAYSKDLEWTTEPPTQTGWYWIYTRKGIFHTYMVHVLKGSTGLYCESIGEELDYVIKDFEISHWLGPLPLPEMP